MKLKETEADLLRYTQIRDEIHDLVHSIAPEVNKLSETNKRMIAHFDVFKSLSQKVQEQIREEIQQASGAIIEKTADTIIQSMDSKITPILGKLEQSVHEAESSLKKTQIVNRKKPPLWVIFMFLGIFMGSFTLGTLLSSKPSPVLSREVITSFQWGQALQNAWPKLSKSDQTRLKKLMREKSKSY